MILMKVFSSSADLPNFQGVFLPVLKQCSGPGAPLKLDPMKGFWLISNVVFSYLDF